MKSDGRSYDTYCKKCRCATRNRGKYPVPCANCHEHRRVFSNGNCKKCNEDAGLRECTGCGDVLARELAFTPLSSRAPNRYKAICKACQRRANRKAALKREYGITPEDYEAMLLAQDERCAICGENQGNQNFAVDHDHQTGEIRGLLCRNCNVGLGHFMDRPDLLRAAIDYIELSR